MEPPFCKPPSPLDPPFWWTAQLEPLLVEKSRVEFHRLVRDCEDWEDRERNTAVVVEEDVCWDLCEELMWCWWVGDGEGAGEAEEELWPSL